MPESEDVDTRERELSSFLAPFSFFITYVPVETEVDFRTLCTIPETAGMHEIKPSVSLDPGQEMTRAAKAAQGRTVAILIPGRRFDASGTRHGRGAGWYDRFLSQIPASWIRIGFCFEDQFSGEALIRQSWDEPMDYVVVVQRDGNHALYRTGARS